MKMDLKNKIYLTALIFSLAGCPKKEVPNEEPAGYRLCREHEIAFFPEDKHCFEQYEVKMLSQYKVDPDEANQLTFLNTHDIVKLKKEGCDLKGYAVLIQELGDVPSSAHSDELYRRIFCDYSGSPYSEIKGSVDRQIRKYPADIPRWEALVFSGVIVYPEELKPYLELRKRFENINISTGAIIDFERDRHAYKTSHEEIKELLRQEEVMRNVRR